MEISIDRAQVDLDFVRCRPSLIESDTEQPSDERRIEQRLTATRHHAGRGKFLLKGAASGIQDASGSAEVELEAGRSTASDISVERSRSNWKRIGPKTIIIGTVVGDLEGMELDDFVGWRVIPDDPTETSGVVAVLSVREDWINFIKVHSDSFVGKIGQKAKSLFETHDKKRQQLFAILLRHLSAKGLSRPSNPNQAVLAVHPFVVKPDFNHATTTLAPASEGKVSLDSDKLDQFLVSAPGAEIETLVALGVSHEAIRENTSSEGGRFKKTGLFTAQSSPLNALKAYEVIVERKSMPRLEMEALVTKRVATDLANLGLINSKDHHLFVADDSVKDPEDMLRYAAAKAESIITARAILIADPAASGEEISEMLITKFNKTYTTQGSKLRVGNALKRWARWLEPHLVDPKGGAEAASLKRSALSTTPAVGRRSYATPENIEIAREGYQRGLAATKIAEKIGVNAETVRRWKRTGLLD